MNDLEKLKLVLEIKDELEYNRVFLDWPYDNEVLDDFVNTTIDVRLSTIQKDRKKCIRMCVDAFFLKLANKFDLNKSMDIEQQMYDMGVGDGVLNMFIENLPSVDYYRVNIVYAYTSSTIKRKETIK